MSTSLPPEQAGGPQHQHDGHDHEHHDVGSFRVDHLGGPLHHPEDQAADDLNADDFAGKGIGSRLMECIMQVARDKGLAEIQGLVLTSNPNMLKLMRGLGFTVKAYPDDPDFRLVTHAL